MKVDHRFCKKQGCTEKTYVGKDGEEACAYECYGCNLLNRTTRDCDRCDRRTEVSNLCPWFMEQLVLGDKP